MNDANHKLKIDIAVNSASESVGHIETLTENCLIDLPLLYDERELAPAELAHQRRVLAATLGALGALAQKVRADLDLAIGAVMKLPEPDAPSEDDDAAQEN